MVMTPSQMLELGTLAPSFRLPTADGREVSLDDAPDAKGYLVAFICNHCPFVKHVRTELAALGGDCDTWGVKMVAINSNDWDRYPDDSPEKMKQEAEDFGYTFDYLLDETQQVAKAYRAACTPGFGGHLATEALHLHSVEAQFVETPQWHFVKSRLASAVANLRVPATACETNRWLSITFATTY
jgi:peroxiredoxin